MTRSRFSHSSAKALLWMVVLLVLPGVSHGQTPPPAASLSPGQWEIRQMMSAGPDANQPRTRTACFSAAELAADPTLAMRPVPPGGRPAPQCSVSQLTVSDVQTGWQTRWQTQCAMPFGSLTTQWQASVQPDRFVSKGEARLMGRKLDTEVRGQRLGDCRP